MRTYSLLLALLLLQVTGCCQQPTAELPYVVKPETNAAGVEYIRFEGIDLPDIVEERPDDVFEIGIRTGRPYNRSRTEREMHAASAAIASLAELARETDTGVLLNSFREGYLGSVDYYVSRDGNWVIAKELAARRPLPKQLVDDFESRPIDVFLGSGGPGLSDLDDLLRMASD